ncbi:MAG: TAXI family TRAP transporter solute-binding subunit [Geminicoccaceae bacterium]
MIIAQRLLPLMTAMTMGALAAQAEVDDRLAVAIGKPGSDSFTFGTELWAMSQIALMPAHGITLDSREVAADEDRLSLLQNREVEAALVYGRVPNAYDDDVRAIMALWPRGSSSEEADPVQFLVHKDVAADVVYLVTKAMFEHAGKFKSAHDSLGIGLPSEAVTGLDIPLHTGAYRYYEESGFGMNAAVTADYWTAEGSDADSDQARATATYRNFDDAALEQNEIDQIAAACRQALEIGSLSVLLGDLSSTGCEVYQDRLIDGARDRTRPDAGGPQSQAIATFTTPVRVAPDGDASNDALAASPSGQGGPAIRWEPSKEEAGNTEDGANDGHIVKPLSPRVVRQPIM